MTNCHAQVALHMICKCNTDSGQKRCARKVSSRLYQSRGLPTRTPNFEGGKTPQPKLALSRFGGAPPDRPSRFLRAVDWRTHLAMCCLSMADRLLHAQRSVASQKWTCLQGTSYNARLGQRMPVSPSKIEVLLHCPHQSHCTRRPSLFARRFELCCQRCIIIKTYRDQCVSNVI